MAEHEGTSKNSNMKKWVFQTVCLVLFQVGLLSNLTEAANKYKTITVTACDSLIKANDRNPDFVILDVRTPPVWLAGHLNGSINRDYYSADFNAQINALPKHKMYLLHCQSGSRSAATFSLMKSLNFAEVYEMSGGISSWIGNGFPTTTKVASLLMLVSKQGLPNNGFRYGIADTLNLRVTNRANDTLRFTSFSVSSSVEFPTDMNLKRTLTGSEDYTFSVLYKPLPVWKDSVIIQIVSNGGNLRIAVPLEKQTGTNPEGLPEKELTIYPNPAASYIVFNQMQGTEVQEIELVNMKGQMVKKVHHFPLLTPFYVDDLPEGIYLVHTMTGNNKVVNKLIINR